MKNLIDEKRLVTIIAAAFFLLGMSVPGFAQFDTTRTAEQAALNLMELFDNVTEIATKTKLNADYVPGMVTVLRGEDLEARGYQTVWEALELVNGIETSVSGTGLRQILIRGVGRTLGSGNIKFFLDGLPINSTFLAGAHQALEFPVELIDRIEVIRGPGSAIYGEFAFTGVINVITNKSGENGHVLVKINNKGKPVPKEKLKLFFEKFNTNKNDKPDGTGLGTTYAYLVTIAHGGEISVKSNQKDGTTILLKFNTTNV